MAGSCVGNGMIHRQWQFYNAGVGMRELGTGRMKGQVQFTTSDSGAGEKGTSFLE